MFDMRKYVSHLGRRLNSDQRGVILIWLIFILVAAGILGSSMVYLTTSSTYDELLANNQARAYYIAEAGGRYIIPIMLQDSDAACALINCDTINKETFTLDNGDKFAISDMDINSEPMTVVSTGIVNQGSWLEGSRKITYGIEKTFWDDPFDDQDAFSNTWDIVGTDQANIFIDDVKTDGDYAVRLKDMNADYKINVGLDWSSNPNVPKLDEIWVDNGERLSYEMQVKIKVEDVGAAHGNYYGIGLSFRLDLKTTPADPTDDTCYGISFFKSDTITANKTPEELGIGVHWYDDFFPFPLSEDKIYLVIWEKEPDPLSGYTVLAYQEMNGIYNVKDPDSININPWSTLVVRVIESGDGTDNSNSITAFVQGPDGYARGTVSWDFDGIPLITAIPSFDDASYTTADYELGFPLELGIHAFYDFPNNNSIYLDDFAMRILGPDGRVLIRPIQY